MASPLTIRQNMASNSPLPGVPMAQSVGMVAWITAAGVASHMVRGWWLHLESDWQSVAMATLAAVVALLPPLWFDFFIRPAVAAPLATVAWRLGILLPVIVLSTYRAEPTRNCLQMTLLACYLMTLPLESWLLIRQSR